MELVRSAKMREVIAFSVPPALAEHLAHLAVENDDSDGSRLGMEFVLFDSSDATQRSGVFYAPASMEDPNRISELPVTLRNVPACECSLREAGRSTVTVMGKLGWNAVFDHSTKDLIDSLPKPQLSGKKKKDQVTREASDMNEEIISKQSVISDNEAVRRSRSTSTTRTRRGRGARGASSSQRSSRARSPVVQPSSASSGFGMIPSPISDPTSSSSSAPAPWANRDVEPKLSTLRMPIRTREEYENCTVAYNHFCSRAQALRRSLLEDSEDAKKQLRELNSNTLSSEEESALTESVKRKRERISKMKLTRSELKDLTDALQEGRRHLQEYANAPV